MTFTSKHFSSPREFAKWFRNNDDQSSGWSRDKTLQGLRDLEDGNDKNAKLADKFLESFEQAVEVPSLTWEHDVAGAFPDVPTFLAGQPDCMWNLLPDMSDKAPLRIWVGVTSSGGISEAQLVKRGAVLAAFAIMMSKKRQVLITPYVNLGSYRRDGSIISWDITTSPINLSTIMASLSEPDVVRHVGIDACRLDNPGVTGAWHPDAYNEKKMREHLGANPQDLFLPSIFLYDPMLEEPETWLKEKIELYNDPDKSPAFDPDTYIYQDPFERRYRSSSSRRYNRSR